MTSENDLLLLPLSKSLSEYKVPSFLKEVRPEVIGKGLFL